MWMRRCGWPRCSSRNELIVRAGTRSPAASRFSKTPKYIHVGSDKNIRVFDGFESDFRRETAASGYELAARAAHFSSAPLQLGGV
jgi:hypothetical protein